MKTPSLINTFKSAVAASAILVATTGLAQSLYQLPASLPASTATRGDGPFTIGNVFTVGVESVKVDKLGAMDVGNDGFYAPVEVGLWTEDGTTLLASVTVSSTDPMEGGYRYHPLTSPLTLAADTTYLTGARVGAGIEWFLDAWPNDLVTANALITLGEARYAGGAFAAPVSSGGFSGRWAAANASLVISGPMVAPTIVTEPEGATRLQGDSVSFRAQATGWPKPAYQWFHNVTNILAGATNDVLTLTNLIVAEAGNYVLVATNSAGSITSNPAMLTVLNPPIDITSGQRLWFKLDEKSGLIAKDSSSNTHDGTLQGFAGDNSQWVGGRTGGAIEVNPNSSVSNVVLVTDTGDLDFSTSLEFTLATWVKASPVQKDGASIIAKGTGNGGEQYVIDVFGGKFRFFGSTGSGFYVLAPNAAADGSWQHIVAVFSRPLNRLKLYLNGIEVASASPPALIMQTSHDVSIGSRQSGMEAYDLNFNGQLDDVRVYSRALTPADVLALLDQAPVLSPKIVVQPTGGQFYACDSILLRGAADGNPPLSYQWQKGGLPIANATNATLLLPSVQAAHAGTYNVLVTNASGSAISSNAVITIFAALEGRLFSEVNAVGNRNDFSGTIGARFEVGSDALLVTRLGFEDAGGDGLNGSHQVGLWDTNGTLLGSVSVPAGTTALLQGAWRYVALAAPVLLPAGSTFDLGAEVFNGDGDGWSDLGGALPAVAATCHANLQRAAYAGGSFAQPLGNGGGDTPLRWAPGNARFTVLTPPTLSIHHSGAQVIISWSPDGTGWTLESASTLSGISWESVPGVINNSVTVFPTPTGTSFFRLRKQ